MLELVNTVAQYIGYVVLACIAFWLLVTLWYKFYFQPQVSPEAKQMAKEVDPNNPIKRAGVEMVTDGILSEIRDLQPNESIRADPAPITHFDWSVDNARQEDIEHILSVLQDAGYYTHPLPEIENYRDSSKWSRERAGIWHSEPDWHIVEFDDAGSMHIKEEVNLNLPREWEPEVAT